jgi:hypothetical protein
MPSCPAHRARDATFASVGLREGWDAEGRVFDVSEAVRTARAWMKRRVEAGVRFAQTYILGRLRGRTFLSLAECNAAIAMQTTKRSSHTQPRPEPAMAVAAGVCIRGSSRSILLNSSRRRPTRPNDTSSLRASGSYAGYVGYAILSDGWDGGGFGGPVNEMPGYAGYVGYAVLAMVSIGADTRPCSNSF